MTEQEQLDAVMALLTAADAHPYTYGDLSKMAAPPSYYTEVTISPVYVGRYDSGGAPVVDAWRVTTRAVGDYESNAREMRRRVSVGLTGAHISGGMVLFESADPIAPDGGWFAGLSTWTYTT